MADDKLKLRILYIRDMLLEETDKDHILSTQEIRDRLAHDHDIKCDRKTVYDDVRSLNAYGMKIESVTGHHPGYYVEERKFSLPELKLLVDAVQASRFITAEKSRILIKKLEELTSRHQADKLQRQVFIYNRVKADNEAIFDTVDILHEAIFQNRKVKFQYCRWNRKKQLVPRKDEPYTVSPWSMTWSNENYYLVGVYEQEDGSQAVRHFRVDKMMETEILDQPREGKAEFSSFDQTAFAKRTFNMYGGQNVPRKSPEKSGLFLNTRGSKDGLGYIEDIKAGDKVIVIGVAAIVPDNAKADSLMEEISRFVEENCEAEILDEQREIR